MRVLVTGGRKYADVARVFWALDAVHAKHGITLLIEGGATGADRHGRNWAKSRGVDFKTCEADWNKYGKAAGIMRNAAMLAEHRPEAVVAFAGKTGTADMIGRAEAAGVPIWKVPPRIFVFGSNLAGRHGAGAAKAALESYGAIYGKGEGLQGHSYGIPTKDAQLRPLSLSAVAANVARFLEFARSRPDLRFFITPVGCGLAGFLYREIAPLFAGAPSNCDLPPEFQSLDNGV